MARCAPLALPAVHELENFSCVALVHEEGGPSGGALTAGGVAEEVAGGGAPGGSWTHVDPGALQAAMQQARRTGEFPLPWSDSPLLLAPCLALQGGGDGCHPPPLTLDPRPLIPALLHWAQESVEMLAALGLPQLEAAVLLHVRPERLSAWCHLQLDLFEKLRQYVQAGDQLLPKLPCPPAQRRLLFCSLRAAHSLRGQAAMSCPASQEQARRAAGMGSHHGTTCAMDALSRMAWPCPALSADPSPATWCC